MALMFGDMICLSGLVWSVSGEKAKVGDGEVG